jgi:hypothetical protein
MAFFFAYGAELIRADLLTRALTGKATSRVVEPAIAGAADDSVVAATGKDAALVANSTDASYDEYAMRRPVATGCVHDAIFVFRQRDGGVDGPVADLLEEHDGMTWGVLFEVSDETVATLCQSFDVARTCTRYDVRILTPLPGAAMATFDVSASIGQTVKASCLVAKDRTSEFMPMDELLMRKLLAYYVEHQAPPSALSRLIPRTEPRVIDVQRGKEDLSERIVCEIYYKAPPRYAIYRSSERVIVQYADDGIKDVDGKPLADSQRLKMAGLNPLRSQITGLIDGWERSENPRLSERARRYNARVAAALNQCLEGDQTSPLPVLTEVRDEIVAERASWGRFLYLSSALAMAAVFCVVFWMLKAEVFGPGHPTAGLWLAARAGTIGAFFSIAMNIQQRKVLTDLLTRDNIADSALRITVGAIGAGVLLCLLQSGIAPLANLGTATLTGTGMSWQVILVIGFAAGFSERLVPTIVEKMSAQDGPVPTSKGVPVK